MKSVAELCAGLAEIVVGNSSPVYNYEAQPKALEGFTIKGDRPRLLGATTDIEKSLSRDGKPVLLILFLSVILFGAFLAIYQFVFNRSLWFDEAALALNIVNRDFSALTKPLDYNPVAPVGFLFIERFSVIVFGRNEFALRIFPLLSFLASIPLFYGLSNKLARNHVVALMATSMFSITLSLLEYSSEVKQYATDVLFTLLILHVSLMSELDKKRLMALVITGSISVWFSNVAIVSLFIAGLHLAYREAYKNRNYRIMLPLLLWSLSFSLYYLLFILNHPTKEYMVSYWSRGFLPSNPFSKQFYGFLTSSAKDMYAHLLGFGHQWLIALLISFGGLGLMLRNRNYRMFYFCAAPILLHLILSALKLYPFSGRLVLYTVPLTILAFAAGAYYLFEAMNQKTVRLSPNFLLVLPVVVMFIPTYRGFPLEKEEIKKSLNYLEKNIKRDEAVYVYWGSQRAFDFYSQTNTAAVNNPIILGTYWRGNHKFDDQIMSFGGKAWLLFSHVYPFKKDENQNEHKDMVELLLSKGGTLTDARVYRGSSVYYFDMTKSKPDRARNSDAP